MRALTLTQPWCGLVAAGLKLVENRSRPILRVEDFGKPFALHASREIDGDVYETIWRIAPEMRSAPSPEWFKLAQRTSAILAIATVERAVIDVSTDPRQVDIRDLYTHEPVNLGEQVRWFFGPIGYVLRDVCALAKPVRDVRGALGFWTLTPDIEAAVIAQITEESP